MARYNPNDERQLRRLREAMSWSRRQLGNFVGDNVAKLRAYVGRMYGQNGSSEARPVNTIRSAVDIWQRKIVTRSPATLVTTRNAQLRPRAYEFQLALNHLLDNELNFGATLEEATKLALMGFSAVKVGLCPTTDVTNPNWRFDNGQPYAAVVLWEDWVHDMNARRFDEVDFAANRFRIDLEDLRSNPLYDRAVVDQLQPDGQDELDQFGESDDNRSTLSVSSDDFSKQEYRDYVEAWEVWLPRDRLIVTMAAQDLSKPIHVREWDGPERGPFHFLTYGKVPGNVVGADPTSNLFDLDDIYNKMFNKVGEQALRQKTLTAFNPTGAQDGTAQTILTAADGEGLPMSDPAAVREIAMGGVNQSSLAFTIHLAQLVSKAGGNLDLLGGLAPQSATAKQDKLLSEGSTQLVMDLQDVTSMFVRGIVDDLGFYLWHDPLIRLPLVKRIPGTDIEIQTVFSEETREGDFYEYNIQIEPHSMRVKSPEERLSQILQLTEGSILKLIPLLQQQGLGFNMSEYLRLISQYANLPEIENLVIQLPPVGAQPTQTGQQSRPPQGTPPERRYVRESVSTGGTPGARDQVLMNALMTGSNQMSPQQAGAALR